MNLWDLIEKISKVIMEIHKLVTLVPDRKNMNYIKIIPHLEITIIVDKEIIPVLINWKN